MLYDCVRGSRCSEYSVGSFPQVACGRREGCLICDYSSKARRETDDQQKEFASRFAASKVPREPAIDLNVGERTVQLPVKDAKVHL